MRVHGFVRPFTYPMLCRLAMTNAHRERYKDSRDHRRYFSSEQRQRRLPKRGLPGRGTTFTARVRESRRGPCMIPAAEALLQATG